MTIQELIESAIHRARELDCAFLGRREVVIILSDDIYRWLYGTSDGWHSLRYDGRLHDESSQKDKLAGFRLGTAYPTGDTDELYEKPFARAAVWGMEYHSCMDLSDVIIVDRENNLYELCHKNPVCFRDIGLHAIFPEIADDTEEGSNAIMKFYVSEDGHLWIKNAGDTDFHDNGECVMDLSFTDDTTTYNGIRTKYWAQKGVKESPKKTNKSTDGHGGGDDVLDDFLNEFRVVDP